MIKCGCQNDSFYIYKKKETDAEKKANLFYKDLLNKYHYASSDQDGNIVLYNKGFLGIGRKKYLLQKDAFHFQIKVIKAVCSCCGKEILLFDNRVHGYNAVIDPIENLLNNFEYYIDKQCTTPQKVLIVIRNELTVDEFLENAFPISETQYQNAFSNISIYIFTAKKKRLVFSDETA